MKYEIDKNKIREGMNEMMEDRINELEETVKSVANIFKEKFSKLTEEEIKYEKNQAIKIITNFGDLVYSKFEVVAKHYIRINGYNSEFQNFMTEKLDEIKNYNPKKLEEVVKK